VEITDHLLLRGVRSLPPLVKGEVQVLAFHVGGDAAILVWAYGLLSPAERERAGRIRVEGARDEFALGRAVLRVLLGSALGRAAEAVPLEIGPAGKPFVPGVYSNVSHSHGWIYVALCRSAAIGIDVERVDPNIEVMEIAEGNFAAEEIAQLAAVPAGKDRARAFCTLWTRKEAVAKADGRGLQISLARIRVPRGDHGPAWIEDSAAEAARTGNVEFHVEGLSAPPDFVASLAVRGEPYPVRFVRISSFDSQRPGVT